jgi:hypothetical protein
MSDIVYKRFSITVDTAATSYNKKFDLDKNIAMVLALQVTSDHPELMYYRGSNRIEINGDEIFPEDYDSRLLMSGLTVPADDRFVEINAVAGNGEIKVLYKDVANTAAVYQTYQFVLIVKCQLKKDA